MGRSLKASWRVAEVTVIMVGRTTQGIGLGIVLLKM